MNRSGLLPRRSFLARSLSGHHDARLRRLLDPHAAIHFHQPNCRQRPAASPEVKFVATGTFSAPPVTVTPLPVNWSGSWSGVPLWCTPEGCAGMNPTGVAVCFSTSSGVIITASAPSDPKLPLDAKNVPMVSGTATLNCE